MLNISTFTTARLRRLGLVALVVVALPVAWYLGSPLVLNQRVSESFPGATGRQADKTSPELVAVSRGQFGAIDGLHKGEGTAVVYRQAGSGAVLRLDDFQVTNGPDLYVYLSAQAAPRDAGQLHQDGAFEIGRLKGNVGSQNYELPADLDLTPYRSVVVYCKRFSVVFSTAELAPAAP